MRKCLKVLNLLIEKKVSEKEGNKLKAWEYEGMIKRHVEKCYNCRTFLKGMYEKSKISVAGPGGKKKGLKFCNKNNQLWRREIKRGKRVES